MKTIRLGSAALLVLVLSAFAWKRGEETSMEQAAPVVVELFTSQGCSSCPPADRLLGELADQGEVIALSFHVDYWNYLGWSDPYSQEAFSQRQRAYAKALPERVYTPQMVFNGRSACVGSIRQDVNEHVHEARKKTMKPVTVELQGKWGGNTVDVSYALSTLSPGQQLQIALVEKRVETAVKRGENGGRQLAHRHVVRQFDSIDLAAAQGTHQLTIPSGLTAADAHLVAYVQDTRTLVISGAAQVGF